MNEPAAPSPTELDADLLRRIGQALYGRGHWRSGLSDDLRVGDRRVRAWAAGERPVPEGVWRDLAGLLRDRQLLQRQLLAELPVSVDEGPPPDPDIPAGGADAFRTALHELGLTQTALAAELDLNITTINRWAQNRTPVPQHVVAYLDLRRRLQRYEPR